LPAKKHRHNSHFIGFAIIPAQTFYKAKSPEAVWQAKAVFEKWVVIIVAYVDRNLVD